MKSRVITAFAAVLAFAVTGCGGGESDSAGGDSGSSDPNAWADTVCTSVKDDIEAISTQPDLGSADPQAAKDALVTYLGTLETSLDGMASAFEDAGTPPVDGGEQAVSDFVDQVGTAKESVTKAKTTVEDATVEDASGFQTAVMSAMEELQALSEIDPTGNFKDNEELNKALQEAPACKELEQASS
ncbi:hypothetical protein [Actinophytocola sediminis]